MSDLTPEEIAEIESDRDYWQVLDTLVGWQMFGFTYRDTASYNTSSGSLYLTGNQRDAIVNAIESKQKETQEYKKSLEVNIHIISSLFSAFYPLKRTFDEATSRQVAEAERRLKALND